MVQSLHLLSRENCWCSTIRGKTPTFSPSIAATAEQSGGRIAQSSSIGWSTPVHWRHDGIDEIVVLGGDFKPNQRLMAYNLADWSGAMVGGRTAAVREEYAGHRRRFAVSGRAGHHHGTSG